MQKIIKKKKYIQKENDRLQQNYKKKMKWNKYKD